MDFHLFREATKEIREFLEAHNITTENQTDQGAMRIYFNLMHKMITPKPRKVFLAKDIYSKANELGLTTIVETIENGFIEGKDMNPHLSTGIKRTNSKSHDSLLNDWNIKHIHLSNDKKRHSDYFYSRTDFLLFVYFDKDNVYFIDIRSHNEEYVFEKFDFLRIINDNWEELNKKIVIKNEEHNNNSFSEEQIKSLRRKGYMPLTEINGTTYFPGQGSFSTRHSIKAGRDMDKFQRDLYQIQKELDTNYSSIKAMLEKEHNVKIDKLFFTLNLIDDTFHIYEEKTKSYF